jgi:hypothetical protein
VSADDGGSLAAASEKLGGVNPGEISALYEKEMPRLVLFVKTLSSDLDGHCCG